MDLDSILSNYLWILFTLAFLFLYWLHLRGGRYVLPQVDLSKKTAIVTGGARGLGKQTVK